MRGNAPTTLADVCESVRYGYTASASLEPCGPRFLRITDIVPVSLNWETVPYCAIDDPDKERFALAVGDIVVARTGATVGYAKLIREPVDAVFASYLVRFRVDPAKADLGFVGRLVESDLYKSFVQSRVGGSAQPNASAPVLGSFEFPLPPMREQVRITAILSAYDDLIENNRRRMALLEDAARQLYREWFVRLRFPGREHTRVTNGVPDGWEKRAFADLAQFVNGYPFAPDELGVDGLPIVKIPELRSGVGDKTPRNTGENIPEKYFLEDGDLLFSWSGTLLIEFWYDGPALLNQHLFRVEQGDACSAMFLLFALRDALPEFTNQTVGATMKHIRKSALKTVTTLLPSRPLLAQFDAFAGAVFGQTLSLRRQNQRLSAARDLLLPRLMSGEIAV